MVNVSRFQLYSKTSCLEQDVRPDVSRLIVMERHDANRSNEIPSHALIGAFQIFTKTVARSVEYLRVGNFVPNVIEDISRWWNSKNANIGQNGQLIEHAFLHNPQYLPCGSQTPFYPTT